MTETRIFTVRRALLWPLGVLLLVQAALLLVLLLQGQPWNKIFFVTAVVILLAVLLAHNLLRRIEVDTAGITASRFGREKRMQFADLTEIEAACLRKRLFVTLWVGESFLLITNAYGHITGLFQLLLQRVPQGLLRDEVRTLLANPPRHNGTLVISWVAVIFSLLILCRHILAG